MSQELAGALRAWRDRLAPVTVGLIDLPNRRASGLRREEVAERAGISVNYLVELEQGRARSPSPSVAAALAAALALDAEERKHLHRLAGLRETNSGPAARALSPTVLRVLDRFQDVPAGVFDPAWTYVAANPLAEIYLGGQVVGENAARRQFLGPRWLEHPPEEEEAFERDVVGDLHRQLARFPADPEVRAIIEELRAGSGRFAELWAQRPVAARVSTRKTAHHPLVGLVQVNCDVLEITGSDLRLVFWSAAPDNPSHLALRRLSDFLAPSKSATREPPR